MLTSKACEDNKMLSMVLSFPLLKFDFFHLAYVSAFATLSLSLSLAHSLRFSRSLFTSFHPLKTILFSNLLSWVEPALCNRWNNSKKYIFHFLFLLCFFLPLSLPLTCTLSLLPLLSHCFTHFLSPFFSYTFLLTYSLLLSFLDLRKATELV